jgi:hypothetical protein
MVNEIGSKIIKDGWVDFQRNPKYCQKKLLDAKHSINCSEETNMLTSGIKSLFKKFIDVDKSYTFYGIKANPKLLSMYEKYDCNNDKVPIERMIYNYFQEFELGIKNSKDSFPFISYDLAIIDKDARVPGKFSWPKMYVSTDLVILNYNVMKDQLETLAKKCFEKELKKPKHKNWIDSTKKVYDANIQPLIFDGDVAITKVPGTLIQQMANVLLQYSGKHTNNYRNPDAD